MSKKKDTLKQLQYIKTELEKHCADLEAFMTGGIGPTQQEYIDKINKDWNGYNFIVVFGHVYRLCNEKKEKDGVYRNPCDLCELSEYCLKDSDKKLCNLMQAETDEYFRDEGELVIDKRGKMKVESWFD